MTKTAPETPFQVSLMQMLAKMPMKQAEVIQLAYRLKSNAAAVSSAARCLEKRGLVVLWRHGDCKWASLRVALVEKND